MPAAPAKPTTAAQRDIAAYLPRTLQRFLASLDAGDRAPTRQRLRGAFLSVDVVGFSQFAEQISGTSRGVEDLSDILNRVFGSLIEIIHAHGGDVWIIAGDAVHSIWPVTGDDPEHLQVQRAALCAVEVQQRIPAEKFEGFEGFQLRAALGCGALDHWQLGGAEGVWQPLLSGEGIRQANQLDRLAAPGDVAVAESAWRHLHHTAEGESLEGGAVRLKSIATAAPLPAATSPVVRADDALLGRYVIRVVADRLAAGQSDYLAELRTVTMLFVRLASLEEETSGVDAHQAAFLAIQQSLGSFEGTLYQCLHDDKGTTVVAAFGLPPLAHDNDARRGVEAAVDMRARLAALGQKTGIGIATGRVFCGDYGHVQRRQYSVVGTTVNLAARLMQVTRGDGILCDHFTAQAARGTGFTELERVQVKGFSKPMRVFRPEGAAARQQGATNAVGRRGERELIAQRIQALRDGGHGHAIFIRAEAGMGKSVLARQAIEIADAAGVTVHKGAADLIEHRTPYYAWRGIVTSWLGLRPASSPALVAERVRAQLADDPTLLELAPLLSAVLPVDLPENELTRQMNGQVRADNVQRLLLGLAIRAGRQGPMALILEDGHWMDSSSWALVRAVHEGVDSALLLVTQRPMRDEPPELRAMLDGPSVQLLTLEPLDAGDMLEIAGRRMGARTIPRALQLVIADRAEGNPFYLEELVSELREAGVVEVVGEECRLVGGESGLQQAHIPNTVAGAITSRVDRLPSDVQLTLKVASVLGQEFELAELSAAHPMKTGATQLQMQLGAAMASQILKQDPASPSRYSFRHAVTHQTTYNLLPFKQLRPLHQAVAEEIERRHHDNLAPYQARLAWHWEAAEVFEKATAALDKAGHQALDAYANQEVISLLSRALDLDQGVRHPPPIDLRRAQWLRAIGTAHYSLSHHDEAERSWAAAAAAAGFPQKAGIPRLVAGLLRYFWHRLRPPRPARDPELQERCLVGHHAFADLTVLALWKGDKVGFIRHSLQSLELARLGGARALSARGSAAMAYLIGLLGLRGAAERDFRQASGVAAETRDLMSVVSVDVLYGMFLSMVGRSNEALPVLQRAVEASEKLHAGLWRHRALHTTAEARQWIGRWSEARVLYRRAALIAQGAEVHAAGLARAMSALMSLRLGDPDEALREALSPGAIPLVRANPVPLSLFSSLGGLIQIHLERGELPAAFAAAEEAEAILKPGQDCNDYYAGSIGHAGIAAARLTQWQEQAGTASAPALRLGAKSAVKRFGALVRLYPGAGPQAQLFTGWFQLIDGAPAKARRSFERAARTAEQMGMPFELEQAHRWLSRLYQGPEREAALARAEQIAAQLRPARTPAPHTEPGAPASEHKLAS